MTTNASLKAVHSVLLRTFPTERVREFWRPIMPSFEPLTEAEVYRHLWNEAGVSPVSTFSEACRRFERFLWENGADANAGVSGFLAHLNGGSWVQAGEFLKRVKGVLPRLFRAKDPHGVVIELAQAATEAEFTRARFRFGPVRSEGGLHSVLGAMDPGEASLVFEGNLISSRLLQMMPVAVGLPSFDGPVFHLSERSPVSEVLWDEPTRVRDGVFYVNRRAHGRHVRFSRFLKQIGMARPPWKFPDRVVVEIFEDYVCPLRKRVVLHAGCAYGAPIYVVRFRWRPARPNPDAYLGPMTRELTEKASDESELIERRQRELLLAVERKVVVEYQRARDSISLDGAILFSGTPARILRHILRRLVAEQKDTFEFRDFKYDPEITRHPKQSSFETRLARMIARLALTDCFRIERVGKGKLRFEATAPFAYRETG